MLSRWILGCVIKAGAGSLQELMRCVLLCRLKAMEDGLCLLEALEVLVVLVVPEVMRCVYLLQSPLGW